jgi:hypothetical protein
MISQLRPLSRKTSQAPLSFFVGSVSWMIPVKRALSRKTSQIGAALEALLNKLLISTLSLEKQIQ